MSSAGSRGGPDTELPAALALCAEQGFTYFHAVVSTFQGANLVLLGSTREGIDLMQVEPAGAPHDGLRTSLDADSR